MTGLGEEGSPPAAGEETDSLIIEVKALTDDRRGRRPRPILFRGGMG